MVLKIYGQALSPFVQVVTVTLNELGVPYEIVPVGGDGNPGYKSEGHLSRQPFGQVPVLEEEDGFLLYESRAIARYIVAKYGPDSGLIPAGDLKKLGLFEQAASVEQSNFHAPALGFVVEKFGKPSHGAQCDEKRAAEYFETFEKNFKVYEIILSKQRYLAGDEITLVDLFHLPICRVLIEHADFTGLKATPNIARWWSDVSGRPSWQSILADPASSIVAPK
ncbi:hypothetical protein M0805_007114 [Coniferiporia weirii]|nr:hypothetical protein M0805_007114 [Coniferiporia weirii]